MTTEPPSPTLWIDADACPLAIKEVVYRAATRRKIVAVFVANQGLRLPASPYLKNIVVRSGLNVADQYIADHAIESDLVVTADIPLAAMIVEKGGTALSPRGELLDEATIGQRLAMRNLLDDLRGEGQVTGGPAAFSPQDKQAFANQLDRWLTRALR